MEVVLRFNLVEVSRIQLYSNMTTSNAYDVLGQLFSIKFGCMTKLKYFISDNNHKDFIRFISV